MINYLSVEWQRLLPGQMRFTDMETRQNHSYIWAAEKVCQENWRAVTVEESYNLQRRKRKHDLCSYSNASKKITRSFLVFFISIALLWKMPSWQKRIIMQFSSADRCSCRPPARFQDVHVRTTVFSLWNVSFTFCRGRMIKLATFYGLCDAGYFVVCPQFFF